MLDKGTGYDIKSHREFEKDDFNYAMDFHSIYHIIIGKRAFTPIDILYFLDRINWIYRIKNIGAEGPDIQCSLINLGHVLERVE